MYQDPVNQGRGPNLPGQNPDNQESLAGAWQAAMDEAQQHWSRLTPHDIEAARHGRGQLIAALQEQYGISRQEADHQIEGFLAERPRKGLFARLAAVNGSLAINQYVSNPAPGPSARDDQPPGILPPDTPARKT